MLVFAHSDIVGHALRHVFRHVLRNMSRHVCRHVFGHVFRHVFGHVFGHVFRHVFGHVETRKVFDELELLHRVVRPGDYIIVEDGTPY